MLDDCRIRIWRGLGTQSNGMQMSSCDRFLQETGRSSAIVSLRRHSPYLSGQSPDGIDLRVSATHELDCGHAAALQMRHLVATACTLCSDELGDCPVGLNGT
jgi:hypothetical protein